MIAVSLVLHVGFVGAWAVASQLAISAPARPPPNIIKTKLVKLGKQRKKDLLPRKAAAPPQPKSKKAPDLSQKTEQANPTAKPAPSPKSASDILKDFEDDNAERPDLNSLIQDTVGEPLDEGHEQGSKLGTEITGRMKANYNDKILAIVKGNYKLPTTLDNDEKIRLKTVLVIRIASDGRITDTKLSPSSGNSAFDNAVLAAAKKSSPLPAPPIQLRDFYASGVGMNFCPVSCS
jgi:TonB family protein